MNKVLLTVALFASSFCYSQTKNIFERFNINVDSPLFEEFNYYIFNTTDSKITIFIFDENRKNIIKQKILPSSYGKFTLPIGHYYYAESVYYGNKHSDSRSTLRAMSKKDKNTGTGSLFNVEYNVVYCLEPIFVKPRA